MDAKIFLEKYKKKSHKNWKKPPQKVAYLWQLVVFFLSLQRRLPKTAQNFISVLWILLYNQQGSLFSSIVRRKSCAVIKIKDRIFLFWNRMVSTYIFSNFLNNSYNKMNTFNKKLRVRSTIQKKKTKQRNNMELLG